MSITVTLSNDFSTAAAGMIDAALQQALAKLSDHYGFSADEAREFLKQVSVKPELLTPKDLPFCGKLIPGCCKALAYRNGLYTQCPRKPAAGEFCKACTTHKDETGSYKYGTMEERLATDPFSFADGKVAPFARLMAKEGWTRTFVEESANAIGWTVPEANFVVVPQRRPRKEKKMDARPLPPLPDDAEQELKQQLVELGAISPHSMTPKATRDELEEEPELVDPIAPEVEVDPIAPEVEPETVEEKKGRKARDYSKLTSEEVPGLNASTLRTACTHHGIETEGKKPATLRVELIHKLA